MCGFLGVFSPRPLGPDETRHSRAAFERLAHRGNTEKGEELRETFALFHHRLAFRDLAAGKQPLTDREGRATILFNGELYGFQALRSRLSMTYDFQTRSDTEVILAAYLTFGDELLAHLDGEYAFVIFDHRDGSILAARDTFGVKPLFWHAPQIKGDADLVGHRQFYSLHAEGKLCFASEMKGLPVKLQWSTRGHTRLMLSLYEEMGTSFANVFALAPGSVMRARRSPSGDGWHCAITRKKDKGRSITRSEAPLDFESASHELKSIISRTVENKLSADVPLGAYLSGGIDSRIAAFEMGRRKEKIETFTVGFEGADYDESPAVRDFLKRFPNLKGRLLRTSNAALEYAYPHAVYASELVQPYTNGSAKWWLSRFARQYVRGVLTGDGSDEIFCGYPSYRYLAWWQFYRRSPSRWRASLYARRVVGAKEKFWEKGLSSEHGGGDLRRSESTLGWAHPLFAQTESLGAAFLGAGYKNFLGAEAAAILSYTRTRACDHALAHSPPSSALSPLQMWQTYFLHTHFPTHVLNWVGDRMEMANTLEGRPIFLGENILAFLRSLPDSYLVRGLRDKAVLRKAYARELAEFAQTPKKQFNAPFLFATKLGEEFLRKENLQETGLIDPALVARARARLQSGAEDLEKSFLRIFLQNCLVTQMLDRYLVRGEAPMRDLAYEERFLKENTETL